MTDEDIKLDHTPLNFGKYRGLSPDELSETDPRYIVWIHKNIKPAPCSDWLAQLCKDELSYGDDTEEELG